MSGLQLIAKLEKQVRELMDERAALKEHNQIMRDVLGKGFLMGADEESTCPKCGYGWGLSEEDQKHMKGCKLAEALELPESDYQVEGE